MNQNRTGQQSKAIFTLLQPGFASSHFNRLRRQVRHPVRPRETTLRLLGGLGAAVCRSDGAVMARKRGRASLSYAVLREGGQRDVLSQVIRASCLRRRQRPLLPPRLSSKSLKSGTMCRSLGSCCPYFPPLQTQGVVYQLAALTELTCKALANRVLVQTHRRVGEYDEKDGRERR